MDHRNLDNEILTEQLRNGDVRAYSAIYDRFWMKLYALAYNQIGTREEAEDLVHNLFENLWKKRAEANIRNLSTYLVVSVKYLSIAYIKSQISLRKFQEYLIFQEIAKSSTEEIINYNDLQKAVEEAMKKLPEKTAHVFKMSRFENKTVRDIAENLGLTEKAVEYHITKSLKVLKEHLQNFHPN